MKKKYRIGTLGALFILAVALVVDGLTLIPFVGTFIGWMFWLGAALYFWKCGLGLINWRRAVPGLISLVGEIVPGVQEFPTIVAAVAVIIVLSRIEDKTGVSMTKTLSSKGVNVNGFRAPKGIPPPLNVDGVRGPQKSDI